MTEYPTVQRWNPNVRFGKPNQIWFGFQMVRILNHSDFCHSGLWSKPNVWFIQFDHFFTSLDHFIYKFFYIKQSRLVKKSNRMPVKSTNRTSKIRTIQQLNHFQKHQNSNFWISDSYCSYFSVSFDWRAPYSMNSLYTISTLLKLMITFSIGHKTNKKCFQL